MRDVKIVIGGCARTVCADIRVPLIFCDRAVSRLQKHQLRMRRLCEEARCCLNRYNPLIKQFKDSQMCNNSGQLFFTCLFTVQADLLHMYGTRPRSGPPAHAFGSINTSSLRPRCPCTRPDCSCGKYNTGFRKHY